MSIFSAYPSCGVECECATRLTSAVTLSGGAKALKSRVCWMARRRSAAITALALAALSRNQPARSSLPKATGRKEHTHTKLYRARPYQCTVRDAAGRHVVAAHDRGFSERVTGSANKSVAGMMLRARFPAAANSGIGAGVAVRCALLPQFPRVPAR